MIWTALACLNSFVNSIVWKDHARDVAPVWCDISSKLIIGVSVGIPASVLCISRRLYSLTSVQTVSILLSDKRRMVLIDLCIAVGIPVVIMVLHYVVQGHRFDILGSVGCYPVVYNSIPAYFLYFMWPLVLGAVSFVYSALTLRFFWLRRAQFTQMFNGNSSFTASRYLRLMLLAIMDMLCTVPLSIFTLYFGVHDVGLRPWISWEDTHFNFSRVVKIQSIVWRSDPNFLVSVEMTRWLPVICAFIFFAMFGFAIEARKAYASAFWAVATRLGLKPRPAPKAAANLPSWVKPLKMCSNLPSGSSTFTTKPSFSIPRKAPPTFTSSVTSSTAVGHSSNESDIESARGQFSSCSLPSPPAYVQRPIEGVCDVPSTPLSDAPFSDTTTVFESPTATAKGACSCPDLKWKLSFESFSSQDRFYVSPPGSIHAPVSPPPFADVVAPGFHRPFSPPLSYPEASPHPTAAVGYVPEGIRVTIQTVSATSEELPSRSTASSS
ncbi:hypothetical protein MD484_g4043, partial [Candolleomyces efflorescens]